MSKYEKVKHYYEEGLWNIEKVKNAVNRWITEDEYKSITGREFKEEVSQK